MNNNNKKAIYYHTSWCGYTKNYQISDIPDCVLDIAYGCWFVDNKGNITSTDTWADIDKRFITDKFVYPADSWNNNKIDYENDNLFGNFGQFKKLKKMRTLNLSLIIGSWLLENFKYILNNHLIFINNLMSILKKYNIFSGIIIDFVSMGKIISEEDYSLFILLLKRIRKAFVSNNLGDIHISLFCSGIPEDCGFDINALNKIVDRIYIMTLDFNNTDEKITNHHSNPRKSSFGKYSCEYSVEYYLSKGINSNKLYITGTLYSRGFSGTDGLGKVYIGISTDRTWETGIVEYNYLPLPGSEEFLDRESMAAYSYDKTKRIFNSYDNKDSIIEKCKIIKQKHLGGIFIYEISSDKDISDMNSIISVIRDNLTHTKPIRLSAIPQGLARPKK